MLALPVAIATLSAMPLDARGTGVPEFHLVLQDHAFQPGTLKVPAGTKFKVLVTNRNVAPSEFESADFNREKIVLPGSTITVFIGPLNKGTYKFFDDFHPSTTGVVIAE